MELRTLLPPLLSLTPPLRLQIITIIVIIIIIIKSKDSKALCEFLQSIREQLLPLYLSNLDNVTATQTSDITTTQTSNISATQTSDILSNEK